MEIKDILKQERKKHGFTQAEVAEKLHIGRIAYNMYETGRNIPTTDSILRLADLYKCSADYLLGRYKG